MSNRSSSLLSALEESSNTPEKGWRNANLFSKVDTQKIDSWPSPQSSDAVSSTTDGATEKAALYHSKVTYGKSRPTKKRESCQQNGRKTVRDLLANSPSDADDEISFVEEQPTPQRTANTHSRRQCLPVTIPTRNNASQIIPTPSRLKRFSQLKTASQVANVVHSSILGTKLPVQPSTVVCYQQQQNSAISLPGQILHQQVTHLPVQATGQCVGTMALPAQVTSQSTVLPVQVVGQNASGTSAIAAGKLGVFKTSNKDKLVFYNGKDWVELQSAQTHQSPQTVSASLSTGTVVSEIPLQTRINESGQVIKTLVFPGSGGSTVTQPVIVTTVQQKSSSTTNPIQERLPQVQSLLQNRDGKHTDLSRRPLHGNKTSLVKSSSNTPATTTNNSINDVVAKAVTSSVDVANKTIVDNLPMPVWPNDGRVAVCERCGQQGKDFSHCAFCKKPLPRPPKFHWPNKTLEENQILKQKHEAQMQISKKQFYGRKLEEQSQPYQTTYTLEYVDGSKNKVLVSVSDRKRKAPGRPRKQPTPEPEMVTISSDEDEAPPSASNQATPPPEPKVAKKQLTRRQMMENEKGRVVASRARPATPLPTVPQSPDTTTCHQMHLDARSVRLGSFKAFPYKPVKFSTKGLEIAMEAEDKSITLAILPSEIVICLAHFGVAMPVFFITATPECGNRIRTLCNMNTQAGPYYDPASNVDCQRLIVVLLQSSTEDDQRNFNAIFDILRKQNEEGRVLFIDYNSANELLVKCTPPHAAGQNQLVASATTRSKGLTLDGVLDKVCLQKADGGNRSPSPPRPVFNEPIVKFFVYPPSPAKGGITVTNEDLFCLTEGEFLNDIIIDFYLKYLYHDVLSQNDRARTHIFNSFFYKRLTGKAHKGSEDSSMTGPQKRHNKVKTWTRHVDVFEKDFIIIPMNENAHWFLAVICFPGLTAPVFRKASSLAALEASYSEDSQGATNTEGQNSEEKSKKDPTSTDSTPVDNSDSQNTSLSECSQELDNSKDKLAVSSSSGEEGQDVPMETETQPPDKTTEKDQPMSEGEDTNEEPTGSSGANAVLVGGIEKQPCILIFDSLCGPSRSAAIRVLREYLQVEWDVRKKTPRVFNKDTIKGGNPKVPQQDNFSDCGVYLCQYAESLFTNPIKDYSIPMKCTVDWFPDKVIKGKRKDLMKIINELKQKEDDKNATKESVS